jgi:hypothetical protein
MEAVLEITLSTREVKFSDDWVCGMAPTKNLRVTTSWALSGKGWELRWPFVWVRRVATVAFCLMVDSCAED